MKYLIDFIVLTIIYFYYFYKKFKRKGRYKFLLNTVMYVYISFVIYFTLMPVIVSLPYILDHPYKSMNMHLFDDYFYNRGDAVRQILLNVLIMVPFGFLLPLIKNKNIFYCAFSTFIFSLTIEVIQPLISSSRISDVTDLVTNTVGGILGYILYKIISSFVKLFMKRK